METAPAHLAVTGFVPYLHVSIVKASIAFYNKFGLTLHSVFGPEDTPFWARLKGQDCDLMLSRASAPIDPTVQAALYYLYTSDVVAFRRHLTDSGLLDCGPFTGSAPTPAPAQSGCVFDITHPHHMPCGELRVHDPDGYVLLVGQLEPLTTENQA